jgi:hypothetical protein
MTNWSMIILGLVAVCSMVWAENSYLVIVPKLLKIGTDNQLSVFIGAASQPVEVKFELIIGQSRLECKTTCKPGETRNATLTLPSEWPVGAGELRIVGTGGVRFEERRDVIVYEDSHVILVQTSSSTYRPGDILEFRVVATNENLIPIENGEITLEIYDATLKLVSEYPRFPIRSGLTETIRFPLAEHCNMGTWLVSATIGNTTSSVEVLVARPVTPSFDVKAIFQRFLLRTEKTLRGVVEIASDCDKPIFGRATIAIGQVTEQDMPTPFSSMKSEQGGVPSKMFEQQQDEEYRKWKSQTMEIAGRVELNYDLQSLFNIDVTRALAIQIYIEVTDLVSGQQRVIRHMIPVFTNEVIYDIRPLEFEAGVKNEFEIIAKRPDGKPTKMEDMILTVRMLFPGVKDEKPQEKILEIKDFYTRGRNDIGLCNFEIPENCIGVLMMLTPLGVDGKERGYRTHPVPLMPMPARRNSGGKLSIELAPANNKNMDGSLVSSQIATIGKTARFYIQLLPSKPVDKFEPVPLSYVLLTNGKITLTGQFTVQPTKACQKQASRSIHSEQQTTPSCVFNGTLPIPITRSMVPYSTLLVYTFQPSFGFNVAESYRFSVAGLFPGTFTLNATVVPYTVSDSTDENLSSESSESSEDGMKWAPISSKAQGKTRLELSFTGTPESTVGLNVVEYDAVLQGIPNDITKERLLHYLTRYEHIPISGMPTASGEQSEFVARGLEILDEESEQEVRAPKYSMHNDEEKKNSMRNDDGKKNSMRNDDGKKDSMHKYDHKKDSSMDRSESGLGRPMPPRRQSDMAPRGLEEDEETDQDVRDLDDDEHELRGSYQSRKDPISQDREMPTSEKVHTHHQKPRMGVRGLEEDDEKDEYELRTEPRHPKHHHDKEKYDASGSPIRTEQKTQQRTRGLEELEEDEETNQDVRGLEDDDEQEQDERKLDEYDEKEHDGRLYRDENDEEQQFRRERLGHKVRYPVEKMIFGIESSRALPPVEGDDVYITPTMGRFYSSDHGRPASWHYRRKGMKSAGQYDVKVENNEYVIATSIPRVMAGGPSMPPMPMHGGEQKLFDREEQLGNDEYLGSPSSVRGPRPRFGTPAWYEKMHTKLNTISKEAFTFLHSGLSIVSDFESLRIPTSLQRWNLTSTMNKFRSRFTSGDRDSFDIRDDARQLLEEYMTEVDASMVPPPVMIEERARNNYYQSVFFNTSRIGSQGTGKVLLPRIKPYSTWLATGFSLNSKTGLSIAQPIRLPTNQGLFILCNFPSQVQIGEHALLTYGINNYLGKDLNNIIVRIRASPDFDLMEQTQPERIVSVNGKDYTVTIPTLKSFGVETRNIVLVPKRAGVIKILLEVESEFGGDYELLTTYVRESGIKRHQLSAHLYDLTGEKKTYGPIVEKITQSPFLRYVKFAVSGTGLDRFVQRYTWETNSLIGVDRALVRLYRALGFRRYLNETSQRESYLFNVTAMNITTAYQHLQLYADYNGSYSFVSDEGTQVSSLYLTSLAFGAMISPMMPFRDNVTLNRTLNYILSRQQLDGSFDETGPCLHTRFCSGEFRRESMTALVLYSLTHGNASMYMPEFMYRQLFKGEQSPIKRAQRFLESRIPNIKSCWLTLTFVELTLTECNCISEQLRQRIREAVLARQLTVVPEDGSKYLKVTDNKLTLDDQLLINSMTLSLYARFGDFKTTSAIARYIVGQMQSHPHHDTVFDAIFRNKAWLQTDCLLRREFSSDKFAITVDVTTDNGQKKQFKIDQRNLDVTQKWTFKLPVQTVTYSVSGFGLVGVCIKQVFVEKQPSTVSEPNPFQLTQEFTPMPWLSEIKARSCVTYTPTQQQQRQMGKENVNNTIVVDIQLPSGMRINLRQLGFFLGKTREVMHFTYHHRWHKLSVFLNCPWDHSGQEICFDWGLERLSNIVNYAPIEVRAYDYVQPDVNCSRLIPVQIQPALLGYSYVDAIHKARPSLENLASMQQGQGPEVPPPPPKGGRRPMPSHSLRQ